MSLNYTNIDLCSIGSTLHPCNREIDDLILIFIIERENIHVKYFKWYNKGKKIVSNMNKLRVHQNISRLKL